MAKRSTAPLRVKQTEARQRSKGDPTIDPDRPCWVEGLKGTDWHRLYGPATWLTARRTMKYCMLIDPEPRELEGYTDFRLVNLLETSGSID